MALLMILLVISLFLVVKALLILVVLANSTFSINVSLTRFNPILRDSFPVSRPLRLVSISEFCYKFSNAFDKKRPYAVSYSNFIFPDFPRTSQ